MARDKAYDIIKENDFCGDKMSNELISVSCPQCGEELNIPAHLDAFSCLYCGQRILKSDLLPKVPQAEGEKGKEYFEKNILRVIADHIGIDRMVTSSEYDRAFSDYRSRNEETFLQLDLAVSSKIYTAEQAASEFLNQLESYWHNDTERKLRLSAKIEVDKFVIAVFLVPMVRSLALAVSEPFCQALQKQWCQRHPKAPFYLGTYEDLSKGFQKKILGLCFITTAICEFEGKPDNCAELTAFRNFRDHYLRSCPDGETLIKKYYDIAPGIVLHIDLDQNRDLIYKKLRNKYLQPCFEDICAGRLQQCKKRYTKMVLQLEKKYYS